MLEQIAQIFKDYKNNQELVITEESTFKDLGLDSLDAVELVMSIEEKFDITIEMSEDIKSVGDLMKIINAGS